MFMDLVRELGNVWKGVVGIQGEVDIVSELNTLLSYMGKWIEKKKNTRPICLRIWLN